MPALHVAYGLRLVANRPIPGLPLQTYTEVPHVEVRLGDRTVSPIRTAKFLEFIYASPDFATGEEPCVRVARDLDNNYFAFFYQDGARFAVQRQGQAIWADWPENYTIEDASTYLLGPVLGFVLRRRGTTCLHASAIVLGDYAIALAGFPGAGKSTLAASFSLKGCPVLSDDVVALVDQGNQFLVQPGYPRVNLWPDSVRALFNSEHALPQITRTWAKRYLALEGYRFATRPLPLVAIYLLGERDATLSEPTVEEIDGREAFMALVTNTYVNYLLDRDMRSQEFEVLSRVVSDIPIRQVRPSSSSSALPGLCETIIADATTLTASGEPLINSR